MMKLISHFLKRITLFSKNKSNALEDNNTSLPESKKKDLLRKKRKEIIGSLTFKERCPQSYELQRKLALLVSNIDKIDKRDIKDLEHRKYGHSKENDLLTSYRIDFHNKDDLENFKTKYIDYLL